MSHQTATNQYDARMRDLWETWSSFNPWLRVGQTMADGLEQAMQHQLDALQRYSQMSARCLRAANDIQDADDMQRFLSQQVEWLSEWTDQLMEDARMMAEIGQGCGRDLTQAFSETGEALNQRIDETARQVGKVGLEAVERTTAGAVNDPGDTIGKAAGTTRSKSRAS
ncbi:phasin family protein [Modicisalibacter coralii]|uniref:phasin family protein n=1 Tax=Modicisalibacter coralii TaxID=2304602 RepID=UPI001396A2EC|nr:phasin family protein [Halomonas coralii]